MFASAPATGNDRPFVTSCPERQAKELPHHGFIGALNTASLAFEQFCSACLRTGALGRLAEMLIL